MAKTYRIKDWQKHYENNKSREREVCSWCPIPNKQDGLGYGRLLQEKDGAALYGAFLAVVLVASKQGRPRDGYLTGTGRAEDGPLSSEDLAIMTKVQEPIIRRMLDTVSCAKIGWIETYESGAIELPLRCPPSVPEVPVKCPPTAPEEKRMEEKGIELNIAVPPDPNLASKPRGELKLVLLSDHEIGKLLTKYTADQLRDAIAVLESYLANKPKKKYDSHYAVMKKGGWIYDKVVVCQPKKPVENKI